MWLDINYKKIQEVHMISVGIDISKGKSTVCILKPYGEIVSSPFEIRHVERELDTLAQMILRLAEESRVVLEATGIYHLPVLTYLQEKGIYVAVVNPYEMKVWIVNSKLNNFFKVILPVLNWCQVTERGMKSVIVKPIHIISKPQF